MMMLKTQEPQVFESTTVPSEDMVCYSWSVVDMEHGRDRTPFHRALLALGKHLRSVDTNRSSDD